jgi:ATP-dependent Lhr-like helicase
VAGYSPALLDELTASGEVLWAGAGALPGKDGWVALYPADTATLLLPEPLPVEPTPVHRAILDALAPGYGLFFRQLAEQVGLRLLTEDQEAPSAAVLSSALWELAWAGRLTNDTLAPLRALLGSGRTAGATAHRARRATPRARYGGPARTPRGQATDPRTAGRWSLLPSREPDATLRAHALAQTLLDRHGIVTRGAVQAEHTPGGFAAAYRVLSAFEETGRARRGYLVEGLGAAQFATDGATDRLRAVHNPTSISASTRADAGAVVLAATDPANAYGAALPWPEPPTGPAGHKPGRKAGALVVLLDGELLLYVERGGRTLLSWSQDGDELAHAVAALAAAVREGALTDLTIERTNGEPALTSDLGRALETAGFTPTPRGLRLRA